jgi:serine protease Do
VRRPSPAAWLLALLCLGPAAGAQQVPQSRAAITLSFAPVVRQAAPAVVNIHTRKAVPPAAVANLSPGLNRDLNFDPFEQGVVVLEVARGSPAARLRLRPGDRVSTLAERRIADVSELARVLQTARPPWRLAILRDGRKLAVVVG